MTRNGSAIFTNPDDYQIGIGAATLGNASVNFFVTAGGDFKARLTWLNLHNLRVLRGCEKLPRIARISLPPERAVVSFPTNAAPATWGGLELQRGDILFRGGGGLTYQWTTADSTWGLLSLPSEQLAAYSKVLIGTEIDSPPVARVLRPSRKASARLLRLHSKVCSLAETKPKLIARPQVARALEQELLYALVNCLTADDANDNSKPKQHHADIMLRFEDALTAHMGPQLNMPALCAAIGVPERTLRNCCTEFLGMSPTRYHLLRRLNMARSALRRADPTTASVAEIARTYGFPQPGRFAVTYRTVFGEMPSTTLRMT